VSNEGANVTATAACGSGQKLVSGGYMFLSMPITQGNSPVFRDFGSAGKWTVMAAFDNTPAKLAGIAYCARGVSIKVRSSQSASIHPNHSGSATVGCKPGETLLAGGYTTTPKPDWENMNGPDLFYSTSYRSSTRSWTSRAHNFSNESGKITVFAYCSK